MPLVGQSLVAATTDAIGSVVSFDTPKVNVGMQVEWSGFTSFSITLEGSVDGVNFHDLAGQSSAGIPTGGFITGGPTMPILYARANLYGCAGTGSLTAIIAVSE